MKAGQDQLLVDVCSESINSRGCTQSACFMGIRIDGCLCMSVSYCNNTVGYVQHEKNALACLVRNLWEQGTFNGSEANMPAFTSYSRPWVRFHIRSFVKILFLVYWIPLCIMHVYWPPSRRERRSYYLWHDRSIWSNQIADVDPRVRWDSVVLANRIGWDRGLELCLHWPSCSRATLAKPGHGMENQYWCKPIRLGGPGPWLL